MQMTLIILVLFFIVINLFKFNAHVVDSFGDDNFTDIASDFNKSNFKYSLLSEWNLNDFNKSVRVSRISLDPKSNLIYAVAVPLSNKTNSTASIQSNVILVLDRTTGELVNQWGSNLFSMPYGARIDNERNVWITDLEKHQVLKFKTINNTQVPILKVKNEFKSANDSEYLCKPVDISVLTNLSFFTIDSCNSRIIKFNSNGSYLLSWPTLTVPHSLEINEAQNLLCTCGYESNEIECYDLDGNELKRITLDNSIFRISFSLNSNSTLLYVLVGDSFKKELKLIQIKTGDVINTFNLSFLATRLVQAHDLVVNSDATELYFLADLSSIFKFTSNRINSTTNTITAPITNKKLNLDFEQSKTYKSFQIAFVLLSIPILLLVIFIYWEQMCSFYNSKYKSYTIIEFTPTNTSLKETPDLAINYADTSENDFDKQFENFRLKDDPNESKAINYTFYD